MPDTDSEYVELAVEIFSMLADATRARIILSLRENERSVNELADEVAKHDHQHDHDPEPHDHDHAHHHPSGFKGLLHKVFVPHSHNVSDSIDDALEASQAGVRAVGPTSSDQSRLGPRSGPDRLPRAGALRRRCRPPPTAERRIGPTPSHHSQQIVGILEMAARIQQAHWRLSRR